MQKKKFFKNFSKNFSPKKNFLSPPYEFWRPRKKFFFASYSIHQNVRTERLKWCVRKVDITSGCLTIMVYFCNNKYCYKCKSLFWGTQMSNQTFKCISFIALGVHFDIWNKMQKKKFQNFSTKFPAKKNFVYPPIRILASKKKNFFSFYYLYQNVRTRRLK